MQKPRTEYDGRPIIICVASEEHSRAPVMQALERCEHVVVHSESSFERLLEQVSILQPHMVVVSRRVLDRFPEERIQRLRRPVPTARIAVVGSDINVDEAVSCIHAGASDVLMENETDRLTLIIDELVRTVSGIGDAFSALLTNDPRMRAAMRLAASVSRGSQPVLITGETGTGKDLMAHAVHVASGRTGAFVVENVAGLDDTLFSDSLFGHKRGAFTGAIEERKGLVAAAHRGTLFLDEIGDLSPRSQVKLLRLIEHGRYYPVGSDTPVQVDVRFVLATNRDLHAMVKDGRFRQDLYYRLAVHMVNLPPLRERPADIPLLLTAFVEQTASELGKPAPMVPEQTIEELSREEFPGNVRELRARVINAVTLCPGSVLAPVWFSSPVTALTPGERGWPPVAAHAWSERSGTEARVLFSAQLPTLSEVGSLLVDEALRRCGGNQSAAAELLGITPSAVNKRLRRSSVSVSA